MALAAQQHYFFNLFHEKTSYKKSSSLWFLDTRVPFSHMVIRFWRMSFGPLLQYNIKMLLFPGSTAELIFRERRKGTLGYLYNSLFSLTGN